MRHKIYFQADVENALFWCILQSRRDTMCRDVTVSVQGASAIICATNSRETDTVKGAWDKPGI